MQKVFPGMAGMGKSSLLAMLKLLHLCSFWPKDTECVLKKLGETTLPEVKDIPDKMKTILLLDALDEDTTAFGRVEERLLEILDATKSFHRVIITCRTQFFPRADKDPMELPGRIEIGGYVCPSKLNAPSGEEPACFILISRRLNPFGGRVF